MKLNHLKNICTELRLGSSNGVAKRIHGGRGGHLLWYITTENGSYAIKQLASDIDLNNEKMVTKYELSETIAHRFSQQGIRAVSAIENQGKHLLIIENIGYLVYPWIEAYTLGRNEVSELYAIKIAVTLAKLHSINMNVPEIAEPRFDIHDRNVIEEAIKRAVSYHCPFAKDLKENQNLILSMNESYLSVIPLLKEDMVVTHGDVDQKNVLWDKLEHPILIDWESAKKMNPTREIVRTSLGWSGGAMPLYTHMLSAYIKSGGTFNKKHVNAALYGVFGSMLNWMLFNIGPACTADIPEERNTTIQEVTQVLMAIQRLNKQLPDLLEPEDL